MVQQKQAKRKRDIKTKLMAAICMLMVSAIMMISSTYAWFTLSTAPEVTGITTAVGANGNLEMALLPKDGSVDSITSAAGDSVKDVELKNVTWGNLVDLSDSTVYGLDKITLFPSELNAATEDAEKNPLTLAEALLKTPTYGADGRVSELVANTFTGYYDSQNGSFAPVDDYGVRAVGTASGMTDRQLSYRNARSAANTAKALAATQASQSLKANGSALANIAIEHGMGSATESYDATDVAALRAIIDDLQGTDKKVGVLEQIEKAYLQYILAYAASAATGTNDAVWTGVKSAVEVDGATLSSVTTALTNAGAQLPAAVSTGIAKYDQSVADVATAHTKLQVLEATLETNPDATFTWSEISTAMTPLANPSAMKLNGYEVSEVKQNLGAVVSSVTSMGGLVVTMSTGGGVYADIADQSGDYTASITIDRVEYNGIELENMEARMNTASGVVPSHLTQIGAAVEAAKAPAGATDGTLPISDMYGYVIDLAFRTNAAESNLLLQQDAVDRIYTDNTNEETMGHGSTMTFKSTDSATFNDNQVLALMGAIRIVFFDPGAGNKVIATAKLDTANAAMDENGWTAEMYLYTKTAGGTTTEYVAATTEQVTAAKNNEEGAAKLYVQSIANEETTYVEANADQIAAGTGLFVEKTTTTAAGEQKIENNAIMPLTQNTAHKLSVLVYLDGNVVGNDDVAATAATSMTGKMNLQFASSANLVPMEYAALNIPAANAGGENP